MRPLFVALLTLLVAGCFGGREAPPEADTDLDGDLAAAAFRLEFYASGRNPVYVTTPHDDDRVLYVVEQSGIIKRVLGGVNVSPDTVLDIEDRVLDGGERGLLGLAFDPDYATNGRFYVHYTDNEGNTVISRFLRGNEFSVDPDTETKLLTVDQPFANHNGGMIAFGPDGMLYVALGDGGSAGDPLNNAQDKDELLGKLLRLDVSGNTAKAASDNPFVGRDGHDYAWAYGLRNPWRFSFDRATGDLYIGDVGQNAIEEIDYQPADSSGGENYGWRAWEGSKRYLAGTADDAVFPIAEYSHGGGRCSVTGGYVYRGSDVPALRGIYLYADYCSGEIWGLSAKSGEWETRLLLDTELKISSWGEDADGELYVVHHGGAVYRVVSE